MRAISVALILLIHSLNTVDRTYGGYSVSNPLMEAAKLRTSIKKLDECFCELNGPVDTCCCDVETVDSLNHKTIHPLITQIVTKTFFRFFKIDLSRECPFWSSDGRCVLRNCHVNKCTEEEVPQFLKGIDDIVSGDSDGSSNCDMESCDEVSEIEKQLSTVIIDGSNEHQKEFNEWTEQDKNFCQVENDSSNNGSYVDLVLNPERFTGYSGHSPRRIWSAIYNENCFKSDLATYDLQDLCLEKRTFYRLISGLHASINIHLTAQYIVSGGSTENPKFGPNLNEFVRRFEASRSNGHGPGWLKNLYFAYLVVLRAVIKAEDLWMGDEVFRTLNKHEDDSVRKDVLELISKAKGCGQNLFDESQLFNGDASEELKEEFRLHFMNISRIMDCVGCDKCRLWGTVQVQGIGTALKILFNGQSHHKMSARHYLTRSEIVALFNVLARFSESIEYTDQFKNLKAQPNSRRFSNSCNERSEL